MLPEQQQQRILLELLPAQLLFALHLKLYFQN
jgi:hypothetical protein